MIGQIFSDNGKLNIKKFRIIFSFLLILFYIIVEILSYYKMNILINFFNFFELFIFFNIFTQRLNDIGKYHLLLNINLFITIIVLIQLFIIDLEKEYCFEILLIGFTKASFILTIFLLVICIFVKPVNLKRD